MSDFNTVVTSIQSDLKLLRFFSATREQKFQIGKSQKVKDVSLDSLITYH